MFSLNLPIKWTHNPLFQLIHLPYSIDYVPNVPRLLPRLLDQLRIWKPPSYKDPKTLDKYQRNRWRKQRKTLKRRTGRRKIKVRMQGVISSWGCFLKQHPNSYSDHLLHSPLWRCKNLKLNMLKNKMLNSSLPKYPLALVLRLSKWNHKSFSGSFS